MKDAELGVPNAMAQKDACKYENSLYNNHH